MIKRNLNKLDLVILAGGKGSRISRLTRKKPKPLIKFKKKYFLSYILNHYSRYPFEKIFILAGYKGEQIYKKFNNKNSNGIEIKCIIEKKTLGTGGAFSQIKNRTKNDLIVINGDTFIDCNLEDFFLKKKNIVVFCLLKIKIIYLIIYLLI